MINYYEVLQIDPKADTAVVHAAYRTLMKDLGKHPDRGGDTREAQRINEAYEHLSDPHKRQLFDQQLQKRTWQHSDQPAESAYILVRCSHCNTVNRVKMSLIGSSRVIQCGKCSATLPQVQPAKETPDTNLNNMLKNLKKNNWSIVESKNRNFDYVIQNNFFLKNFIYIKKVPVLSIHNVDQIAQMCKEMFRTHITPVGHYFVLLADKIEYISYVIEALQIHMKEMKGWNCGLIIPVDLSRQQVFLSHVNLNHHPADILQLRRYIFN